MAMDPSNDSGSDWNTSKPNIKRRASKRRKPNINAASTLNEAFAEPSTPIMQFFTSSILSECDFEDVILDNMPSLMHSKAVLQEQSTEVTPTGLRIRPIDRIGILSGGAASHLLSRKLKMISLHNIYPTAVPKENDLFLEPMETSLHANNKPPEALEGIETTPHENSFLARLHGHGRSEAVISVDWNAQTPWINLMLDIREHYSLAHPDREQPLETLAPITYTNIVAWHLPQVHDLLTRSFWPGIDVSDALDYWPERSTIVVLYKKLVIGFAMISSPHEPYITYLVVKSGWDRSHVARTMLYHLISLNPKKDITLHVSATNSAMLLYNRFGFKAEEFVARFYEAYLGPLSRQSTNAYRLRLRQR